MKILIVGGVAGGASAAARARRLSETAEIILFERGPDVSFANCGLPYYVGGQIVDRGKLLVTTPVRLRQRFGLDVRVQTSVEAIDRQGKRVRARDLRSGREYEETYDKLILSPGAAPVRPPIPGQELAGVCTLRNLADVDGIKACVDSGTRRAVVVGAGFIGLEMVENLVRRQVDTTLVELRDQVLPQMDGEMTRPLLDTLVQHGVRVRLGESARELTPAAEGVTVHLTGGDRLTAELVVLAVGVRPDNRLAVEAGLEIGSGGGIRVNRNLQTSDPDIYAVGDAIEVPHGVTGQRLQLPLAGPANRQGRLAADHILGRQVDYRGTQGTAIVGVFDRTAAMTGATEAMLARDGRAWRKVYIHPGHHAGYYPGAEPLTLKLLFDPETGRILGAQAVGGSGVDKRIDILAVAIQAGMTVYDLEEMELAYAPQFGSAKDPINMLGFVASGLLRGDHPQVDWETVMATAPDSRPLLLDVRTAAEFAGGSVPGAVSIPLDELRERLDELPQGRTIACFCQVGQRGYVATRILTQRGFPACNLAGGYTTYRRFYPEA